MSEELADSSFVHEQSTRLEHSPNLPQSIFRFLDVITSSEINNEIDGRVIHWNCSDISVD